jgi:flagellar basal body rod protein FlgC
MDMRDAQRAYSANLSMIENEREMLNRTLDLLNK